MSDPFHLQRFVDAQETSWAAAFAEMKAGRKCGHWMWFVFPQMQGLGRSGMAWEFGISSIEEARAYLGHPILGPRLIEVTRLALGHSAVARRVWITRRSQIPFIHDTFCASSGGGHCVCRGD